MRCPFCSVNDDKVIDSREVDGGGSIRRRRECKACDKRFTTYEHVETHTRLTVVKRDGSRVPFDREKLLGGLIKATYKRPVAAERLAAAADAIEAELFQRGEREVVSEDLARLCRRELRVIDAVAFVRYASADMAIDSLDEMAQEISEISGREPPPPSPNQGQLFNAE